MSRRITMLIGFAALVGLAALLGGRGALAQGTGIDQTDAAVSLYWYERTDDVLLKGNADGSGTPSTCLNITNDVRGLAIDSAGGKLYWLERDTNRLRRANVNCSGVQTLSESLVNPDRLALDLSAGRLYWTENDGSNRIRRANLDGSNVVTVLDNLGTPVGVAVDPANGFLYWTELDPPAIWRSTLAGTNKVKIVPLAVGSGPLDVVVDAPRGRILWINSGQGAIYTAGLDGNNPDVWLDLPDPRYVIVDEGTGQVYWGDHDTGEIRRANANGSNNQLLFSTTDGVFQPRGLSLYQTSGVTCYSLTRNHSGQGSDPVATPNKSAGCATGHYVAGESISLSATPAAGWRVAGWSGTNNDGSSSTANTVTMPASNHAVSVLYEQTPILCYSLTRGHSGQGNDPIATPAHSAGCGTGQYVAGEVISLSATPAAGWRVANWSGTNNNSSASTTNAVTMPAAARTVAVTYVRAAVNTNVVLPAVLNQNRFLGPQEIEPNNRSNEANGPLMFNRSYQGYPNDLSDYYSFDLTSAQQITVILTNITGKDPQLQLYYNSTANRVDYTAAPPYRLVYNGAPGRYYARVVVVAENNSATLYTLRIEAAAAE